MTVDLSKYNDLAAVDPDALKAKYLALREELERLLSVPEKDMTAVDAVMVEIDEVHAGVKDSKRGSDDAQRF